MKLARALKHKGKPFNIPNSTRDDLPIFIKEMGYKVGAEIGVYKGEFIEKFCKENIKMYAIDPWIAYRGAGSSARNQAKLDSVYEHATKILAPYKNCEILKKTSMEAVKNFRRESLDFIYIDGDHRFPYIAADIYEWYPIIKKGGIISGHDYFCTDPGASNSVCHVKTVVNAFVETFAIPNFYLIGDRKSNDGKNKIIEWPSWMFIKP